MKVFDVHQLTKCSTGDELILLKAIVDHKERYKDMPNWQVRDAKFEEETKAKLTYTRIPGTISHILFEDEDWFWFKAKWL